MRRAGQSRDDRGCARRPRAGAFTLIELLVTISIIGVLLGILTPVLSSVRQSARRTKCMANLHGVGQGFQVYLNTNKHILPRALPLDDSQFTGQAHAPQPDSILANLGPMVESEEVFICPSDDQIPESLLASADGPVGRHCSYEYWAGWLMLFRELQPGVQDQRPEFTVTKYFEEERKFPVMADSAPRHPGGPVYDQNALYFGDWHVDWMTFNPVAGGANR